MKTKEKNIIMNKINATYRTKESKEEIRKDNINNIRKNKNNKYINK